MSWKTHIKRFWHNLARDDTRGLHQNALLTVIKRCGVSYEEKWHEFFEAYELKMDDRTVERIYWWAARTSFAIALWHVEHEYDCRAFLQDFLAAVNMESNPHAVFER